MLASAYGVAHRLRQAGLLDSMGRVAGSVDNSMIERPQRPQP